MAGQGLALASAERPSVALAGPGCAAAGEMPRRRRAGGHDASSTIHEIQRVRLLTAMAAVCREMPAAQVSVAHVVAHSGVSRRTFYESFKDREDCLRVALREALRRARDRVIPAYRSQPQWQDAMRAAVEALLAFLDEDRLFGTLLIVDGPVAGDAAPARRDEAIGALVDAVDRGRGLAREPASVRRSTAEGLVGGVLFILRMRLLSGRRGSLMPLANELTAMIVAPYLGPAMAARELTHAMPEAARGGRGFEREALGVLEIRVTHRTVQVLHAIAELDGGGSGPSNVQIAARAGIADPGQASKLLSRLAGHGLIVNHRRRSERGEANSWQLTAKGAQLERAMRRGIQPGGRTQGTT